MPTSVAEEQPPFQSLPRQGKPTDPYQKGYYGFYPSESWTPCVNLYETARSYLICVDLAGVEKEKIDVQVADQRLTLRGTRQVPSYSSAGPVDPHEKVRIHLMEIDHGGFTRDVEIPTNANRQKITASYRNGMLWIEIPKTS